MRFNDILMIAVQTSGGAPASGPSSVGPNSPSATVGLDDNFEPWSGTANLFASDNTAATVTPGSTSDTQRVRAFGFSVPGGATIVGVKAEIEAKLDVGSGRLSGVALATNFSADISDQIGSSPLEPLLTTSDAYYTFGGPSDLWGASLTPAVVNSANFSVDFSVTRITNTPTFSVDHVRVTVYYT